MWALTSPGSTTFPLASRTRSKGPSMAAAGARRAIRPSSRSRACPSSTRHGLPRVRTVPFRIRIRIRLEADLSVERRDQLLEVDDLVLEELAPVLGIPLRPELLVRLPLLLDPRVVLQVVDRLAVRVA